jgi:peptidoglycan/xylan/chitin deacetylase (PgdA/CDA1 family)
VKEHFGYEMFLFRPPTGEFSIQSLAVVQNLGYKNVHWSFAYLDYDTENQPDPAEALARMTDSVHNGCIYLIHAISTTNAAVLGDLIDFCQNNGYQIELFR